MMGYEKEIAELWKEWKESTEKYEEANEDGYDVDAEMWANDVETIHRQIHLYEQAAKADEYEAKAKAFDEVSFIFADSIAHDYDDHSIVQNIARVIEKEKGDYYD